MALGRSRALRLGSRERRLWARTAPAADAEMPQARPAAPARVAAARAAAPRRRPGAAASRRRTRVRAGGEYGSALSSTEVTADEDARALMAELAAAPTAADLARLLEARWGELNARHLAASFLRLARLPGGGLDAAALRAHPLPRRVATALEDYGAKLHHVAATSVLDGHAALGLASPQLLDRAREALAAPAQRFSASDVVRASQALAKLGLRAPEFDAALLRGFARAPVEAPGAAARPLDAFSAADFSPAQLGILAAALARARCAPGLADALCLEGAARAAALPARSAAALARLGAERASAAPAAALADALARAVAAAAGARRGEALAASPRDALALLSSFARLARRAGADAAAGAPGARWDAAAERWLGGAAARGAAADALCAAVARRVQQDARASQRRGAAATAELGPRALADAAYAAALLRRPAPALVLAVERRFLALARARPGAGMDARSLAALAWSHAALSRDSEEVLEATAAALAAALADPARHGELSPQSCAMALTAYAKLDRFGGPHARALLAALAAHAAGALGAFSPHGLAQVGWAMAVAAGAGGGDGASAAAYDHAFMRRWRGAVAAAARDGADFPPHALLALHHVDVALRLEAPDIGAAEAPPAAYVDLLRGLYAAGRTRVAGAARWGAQAGVAPGRAEPSRLHARVVEALRGLPGGAAWRVEHYAADVAYSLDAAVPALRAAVEADGPSHFCGGAGRPTGATALKRRLMRRAGWRLVSVPWREWSALGSAEERRAYMEAKLRVAGIEAAELEAAAAGPAPPEAAVPPAAAALAPEEVQERAQRLDLLRLRSGKLSAGGLVARAAARAAAAAAAAPPVAPDE